MTANTISKLNPWNWFRNEDNNMLPLAQRPSYFSSSYPTPFSHPLSNSGFSSLYQEMDRMFGNVMKNFGMMPQMAAFSSGLGIPAMFQPTVNIASTDQEYTITMETPGIDERDIRLTLSADNTLTITGEKRIENQDSSKDFLRVERAYGSFQRTLSLPEDAQTDTIRATCENGVLTIVVPRLSQMKSHTKQIEINAANTNKRSQEENRQHGKENANVKKAA